MVCSSLNEKKRSRAAVLGYFNEDIYFEYGESTTVYAGCGATLMDQFWYFGGHGSANKRQVS